MKVAFFRFPDRAAWQDATVAALADALTRSPDIGRMILACAGGKTPEPILKALAERPLPWADIDVIPTDERLAPEGHPARNVDFLARCLERAVARGAHVHALEAAAESGRTRPAVALLGMGADQHIASLFPGTPQLERWLDPFNGPDTVEITPDPLPPEAPFRRLSLTMFALTCAREIILAATGEEKLAAIESAQAGDPRQSPLAALFSQTRAPVRLYWAP